MTNNRTFFCAIQDDYITEKQCLQFHSGGKLPNQKTPNDFSAASLPCLNCEGLVRPNNEMMQAWGMLHKNNFGGQLKQAFYRDFFVLAHNDEFLLKKLHAMLDMMRANEVERLLVLGDVYRKIIDEPEKAFEAFQKAYEISPTDVGIIHLAELHIEAGQYKEALELLNRAKLTKNASAHYWQGVCYEHFGKLRKAREHYEQALSLKREKRTFKKLAHLYFHAPFKDYAKSKKYFDAYISDEFDRRESNLSKVTKFLFEDVDFDFLIYAYVLYELKMYERSLAYLKRFIRKILYFETKADIELMMEEDLLIFSEYMDKKPEYLAHIDSSLKQLVGQVHLLRAKCHFQLDESDDAKRYIRLAHRLLESEEEIEKWMEQIEASVKKEDTDYFLSLLQLKGYDLAEMKDMLENINDEFVRLKLEMDATFQYHGEIIEKLKKRYGNFQDGQKLMKNELEKLRFEKLVQLENSMEPELQKLSKRKDYQPVGNVIELISTSEFLFHHFKPIFDEMQDDEEKINIGNMDSTFVVVCYFKALEVFLAKKISSFAANRPILKYEYDRDNREETENLKVIWKVKIGEPPFYRQTFSTYYTFIEHYDKNNRLLPKNYKYVGKQDPVKLEYVRDRANLAKHIHAFVKKYRNKFSHKATLKASEVTQLRKDFYILMKELLEKLK